MLAGQGMVVSMGDVSRLFKLAGCGDGGVLGLSELKEVMIVASLPGICAVFWFPLIACKQAKRRWFQLVSPLIACMRCFDRFDSFDTFDCLHALLAGLD
jgi:hypothetical protein